MIDFLINDIAYKPMKDSMSPKLKEKLEQIHSGKQSQNTIKSRRFSRGILLMDIVVIIAIMVFFTNRLHDSDYKSASIKNNNIEYIISVKKTSNSLNVITNMINRSSEKISLNLKNIHYSVLIQDRMNRNIIKIKYAEKEEELSILSGESKTFINEIPLIVFKQHTSKFPDSLTESGNKPFSFGKSDIYLSIILNAEGSSIFSTKLNFSLGVK